MSAVGAFDFDPTRAKAQPGAGDTRSPGAFDMSLDSLSATIEGAFAEVPGRHEERRQTEMAVLATQLARLNGKPVSTYLMTVPGEPGGNPAIVNEIAFREDLDFYRKTVNPNALPGAGKTGDDFNKGLVLRERSEAADRAERMANQGWVGNILGSAVGGFSDPINLATMPIGGGSSLARNILARGVINFAREGAINAGVEALESPFVGLERKAQGGEGLTAEEFWTNVGGAFVGGGAFDLGMRGIGAGVGAGGRKLGEVLDISDRSLALALRAAKPDYALSPEEMAALHMTQRQFEVDSSSPYVGTMEAQDFHARKVDEFVRAWSAPAEAAPALAPVRLRPAGAGPRFAPDFDRSWAAIIANEGGTNPDGSFRVSPAGAIGPSQLMPGTAPEAMKLAGFRADDPRWRTDATVNIAAGQAYFRKLIGDFGGDLDKAAAAYNGGAGNVRRAVRKAREAGVPGDWLAFIKAKETRDYVANFRRRTAGAGGAANPPGEAGGVPDGGDIAPPSRPAALDAEPGAMPTPGRVEVEPAPPLNRENFPDDDSFRVAQAAQDADLNGSEPAVTWAKILDERREDLVPELRRLVGQPGRDINDVAELARELGVPPELLREGMLALAEGGELVARRSGFSRPGGAPSRGKKPQDVLDFIAKAGGIRDDEGHNLGLKTAIRFLNPGEKPTAKMKRQARRNREFGNRNLQTSVPGAGLLLRKEGLSIDAVGEMLDEAGYLHGADGGRPSVREVIDYLDKRVSSKQPAYRREDLVGGDEAQPLPSRDEAISFHRDALADHATRELGFDPEDIDSDFLDLAAELKYDLNLDDGDALRRAINQQAADALDAALDEGFDYDDIDFDWPADDPGYRAEDFGDEGDFGRYEPVRDYEGEGGDFAETLAEGPGDRRGPSPAQQDLAVAEGRNRAPTDPAIYEAFDDPAGDGIDQAGEDVWHDIGALLDAADEAEGAMLVDLEDGRGERRIADVRDELDAEAAGIEAIKGCLA